MKRFVLPFAVLLCLLHCVPSASARSARDWSSVRSTNFVVVGKVSSKELAEVGRRLEQFREVFFQLSPDLGLKSAPPTTVIVFENDNAYTPFKPLYQGQPQNVDGYFLPGHDVSYITLKIDGHGSDPYRTIFHEYVHELLNDALGKLPRWFDEGLAEYYSTLVVSATGRRVTLGREIPSHLALLRREKLFPLALLFSVGRDSPYYHERDKRGMFYAESWELMHYLMQVRRPQLKRLLGLLTSETQFGKAYSDVFPESVESLEIALDAYTQRKSYTTEEIDLEQRPGSELEQQSRILTEAEAEAYLGDLLLHLERLDEAAAHLEHAVASDPVPPMALASLGMLCVRQKSFNRALNLLRESVQASPRSYLAHYYYAFGLSRERVDDQQYVSSYLPEQEETMRSELLRSIDIAPDFPDAYYLLAFVNIVNGERLDESVVELRRALMLSPRRQDFKLLLAHAYIRKRDTRSARSLLEPLLSNSATPEILSRAEFLLSTAASVERELNAAKPGSGKGILGTGFGIRDDSSNLTPPTLESALRKPRDGERRAGGRLIAVQCTPRRIIFLVREGSRTLSFDTEAFDRMIFYTFTPNVKGEITCGVRNPSNPIVVTYRPAKDPRKSAAGEAVTIEFVPEDFELKIEEREGGLTGFRPD